MAGRRMRQLMGGPGGGGSGPDGPGGGGGGGGGAAWSVLVRPILLLLALMSQVGAWGRGMLTPWLG